MIGGITTNVLTVRGIKIRKIILIIILILLSYQLTLTRIQYLKDDHFVIQFREVEFIISLPLKNIQIIMRIQIWGNFDII